MTKISIEWVSEIPEPERRSPYDPIADRVRESGEIARIETTKGTVYTLANRLRNRYKDLMISSRTLPDGFYVYIGPKVESKKPPTTKKGKANA